MRAPAIPLLLSGLLAGAALAPAAAYAYPYTVQRYTVETYTPLPRPRTVTVRVRPGGYGNGYGSGYGGHGYGIGYGGYGYGAGYRPLAVAPVAPVRERRCQPGSLLTGAVVGGGLGAVLADGSRNRRWAVPMGAAVGGLVGGVIGSFAEDSGPLLLVGAVITLTGVWAYLAGRPGVRQETAGQERPTVPEN